MEEFAFGLVGALVGVGTEEVALGLEEVRWQAGSAVAIVVAEACAERGDGDAVQRGDADDFAPVLLGLAEHVLEEGIEHEVGQICVVAIRIRDAVEELCADDATAAPDRCDAAEIEIPHFLFPRRLDEIEALGVADDLRGVESVVHFLHEVCLVDGDIDLWAGKLCAGSDAFFLLGGKDAGLHGGIDGADDNGVFRCIEQRPLAGALLPGLIDDELDDGFSGGGVLLFEGFAGDLNEVAEEVTFVPLIEDGGHLVGGEAGVLEDVVGFADELHVAILDAVVDHLDVVTCAARADVDDARFAIHFRSNAFEDGLHDLPSALGAARHDGWAFAGAFFTAGDAGTDEAQAFRCEISIATLGGLVVAVAAIDDDVVLFQEGDELLDHSVNGVAIIGLNGGGLHHDLNLPWRGQGLDELLERVGADEIFVGIFGDECVGRGRGAIKNADLKAAAFDVQHKVLAHYGEANQSEVTFFAHRI